MVRRILLTLTITIAFTWMGGLTGHLLAVYGEGDAGGSNAAITITAVPGRVPSPGGGGGIEPAPTPPPIVSSGGVFTQPVTLYSKDSTVSFFFPEGTVATTADGTPLPELIVEEEATGAFLISMGTVYVAEWEVRQETMPTPEPPPPPPPEAQMVGRVYDAGPDGTHFYPPITLTFAYNDADLSWFVNEEDLSIAWWDKDNQQWVGIADSVVDPENNTITAPVSHFTAFSILAALRPAQFVYSGNLYIEPPEVEVGQMVNIIVSITNVGGQTGSHQVMLSIDGKLEATQEVVLAPGDSQLVFFSTVKSASGTYTVVVDDLTGSFTVKEKPVEPPPPPAPPPTPPPTTPATPTTPPTTTPFPWWIIVLVLINIALVYLLLRGRLRYATYTTKGVIERPAEPTLGIVSELARVRQAGELPKVAEGIGGFIRRTIGWVGERGSQVWSLLQKWLMSVAGELPRVAEGIGGFIRQAIGWLGERGSQVWTLLQKWLMSVAGELPSVAEGIGGFIRRTIGWLGERGSRVWALLQKWLMSVAGELPRVAEGIGGVIRRTIGWVGERGSQVWALLWKWLMSVAGELPKVAEGIGGFIRRTIGWVGERGSQVWSLLWKWLMSIRLESFPGWLKILVVLLNKVIESTRGFIKRKKSEK